MPPVEPPLPVIGLPWWLDLLSLSPILIAIVFLVLLWRKAWSGDGYMSKQAAYLEHQRSANERALEQNKVFEAMTAQQYAETNQRTDRALEHAAEALKLHAASLVELNAIKRELQNLTHALKAGKDGSPT